VPFDVPEHGSHLVDLPSGERSSQKAVQPALEAIQIQIKLSADTLRLPARLPRRSPGRLLAATSVTPNSNSFKPPRACDCWIDRREHGRSLAGRLHFLKNLQKRRSNPTPIYGGRSRHPPLPIQVRTVQIKTTVCESPGLGGTMRIRHSHDLTDTNSAVREPDT
jgi:hypothetical protein